MRQKLIMGALVLAFGLVVIGQPIYGWLTLGAAVCYYFFTIKQD